MQRSRGRDDPYELVAQLFSFLSPHGYDAPLRKAEPKLSAVAKLMFRYRAVTHITPWSGRGMESNLIMRNLHGGLIAIPVWSVRRSSADGHRVAR